MRAAAVVVPPEVEVADRPNRRNFTAEYKRRILDETDKASPGEIGAILRREGLYSSHLVDWRRARRVAELEALAPMNRGPAPKPADERDWRTRVDPFAEVWPLVLEWLEAELDRVAKELFQRLQHERPEPSTEGSFEHSSAASVASRRGASPGVRVGGRGKPPEPSNRPRNGKCGD